ncbi:alpha-hydroxy acid oxidase [Nocardiopsis mangrovi]|uniref:Alpha-hydroxy acid oxidase n=1 Tax=Nocardiopsis mangrovi TaxID=1179818 RepID=A0ABV9DUP6_9ACTN
MSSRKFPRWSDVRPFLARPPRVGDRVDRRLARCLTIADLEAKARRRVPPAVWDYVHSGAEAEASLRRNREAFERVEWCPTAFEQVGEPDLSTEVLGRPAAMPVVLAPTGYTRMSHHTGESAVVRAAERAGVPYALSTYATTSIPDVAAAAPGARRWFQLYLMKDRAVSREHLRQARECGYEAVQLTIDTSMTGQKLKDERNGFGVPPRLSTGTLIGMATHPRWVADILTTEPLSFATFPAGSPHARWGVSNRVREQAIRPSDVAWVKAEFGGPVLVKGVVSVRDAVAAADAGADAVVLSNHGGRQLDRTAAPLELLPAVADAVGDRVEVHLDSGVRSGADAAAALALGARAVMIGRPYLYGLMAGGGRGVDRCLEIIRSDLTRTLSLLGARSVSGLTPAHVRLRDAP